MTENMPGSAADLHPVVAKEFDKLSSAIEVIEDKNRRLAVNVSDEKRALENLERQEIHVYDMPGKQMPFKYQINIPLPGGSDDPVTGTVNISRDGPFVCRRIYASLLVTDAPFLLTWHDEEIAQPGVQDYRVFIGRYVSVSSRNFWTTWNFPFTPFSRTIPPPLDFEWEYKDSGTERNRQDRPLSGDILYRQSDDGYMMNNDIFGAGVRIDFTVRPTHPVLNIVKAARDTDETVSGPMDVELQVTFDGYKILQPLEL